jgi:hypothetical protein
MGRLCVSVFFIFETTERISIKFRISCLHQNLSGDYNCGPVGPK